jgi:hypothetical protein
LDAKIRIKYLRNLKLGVSIRNGIATILQHNQRMKHCFNTQKYAAEFRKGQNNRITASSQ